MSRFKLIPLGWRTCSRTYSTGSDFWNPNDIEGLNLKGLCSYRRISFLVIILFLCIPLLTFVQSSDNWRCVICGWVGQSRTQRRFKPNPQLASSKWSPTSLHLETSPAVPLKSPLCFKWTTWNWHFSTNNSKYGFSSHKNAFLYFKGSQSDLIILIKINGACYKKPVSLKSFLDCWCSNRIQLREWHKNWWR